MSEEELIELFPELRDEPADKVFKILDEQEPVFDSEEEADAYYSEMAGFAEAVENGEWWA